MMIAKLKLFVSKVAFQLSGLVGPTSQFSNGMHELSELVLARMVLLMDQSRSVLPIRSVKRGNLEKYGGSNVRARL